MIKSVLYRSECYMIFNQNQAKDNTIMIALNKAMFALSVEFLKVSVFSIGYHMIMHFGQVNVRI